ncbi:MAG: two-component sensor histidine kinase, partial [Flavobacterium psychrophilum]
MSMFSISFRNRVALHYSISTAVLVAIIFVITFLVVKNEVISNLDSDLTKEINDLYTEISITDEGFSVEKEEWYEKEHITLDINPIFIQFVDREGQRFDRSPNLKKSNLSFLKAAKKTVYYDTILDSIPVRQVQAPVLSGDALLGYILVAVPLKSALDVIVSLEHVLLIAYPLILMTLFLIARFLAGRGIRPVVDIIEAAQRISHENLSARIPLPKNKDILYTLALTINNLLDRIEGAVQREKQFTSDASHELRTPVAVIRGTLEVLIRKPRSAAEYVENIQYTINEM